MTPWIVVGGIVLALFLLSLVRVGGVVEYSATGLVAQARVGLFRFTLYPAKKKKSKQKPEKKPEQKPEKDVAGKPGGSWQAFQAYLPVLGDTAGRLHRKIRVDRIYLDYIAAASDPAAAAMAYGYANAAVGMVWPLLEHNFNIKDRRIRTAVDFQASKPTVYVYAALSLSIGQAISVGMRFAIRFLKASTQTKAEEKTEKEAV